MRGQMTRNQFYASLKELAEAIVEWLEKLPFSKILFTGWASMKPNWYLFNKFIYSYLSLFDPISEIVIYLLPLRKPLNSGRRRNSLSIFLARLRRGLNST